MKQIVLSTFTASQLTCALYAGGDITLPSLVTKEKASIQVEEKAFIKTVNGYIRAGYQSDGDDARDVALGGKLHVGTHSWNGISAGASFYTTHTLGSSDGAGVPFFDADNNSYSILGEAYLVGEWGNTSLKIGRQEIDTPFLDTDDIGMVPNTFEAVMLVNKDIKDLTITLGHIEKMAGVDAEIDPAKFEKVRDNDHIQLGGLEYDYSEKIALSGWYYHLHSPLTDNLLYADITYTDSFDGIAYEIAAQYAHRNLSNTTADDAHIYGGMASIAFEKIGLTLSTAYNGVDNNYATNGFGGGPFYTSMEHLTLRESNEDGNGWVVSGEWDMSSVGLEELSLSAGYLTLKDNTNIESTELDLTASYTFNDALSIDVIYSDVEDDINDDSFENTRVFINYQF